MVTVSREQGAQWLLVQPDAMTNVQTPFYFRLKGPAVVYTSAVGDTVTHDTSVQVKMSHP